MIDLELPDELIEMKSTIHRLAKEVFRPISRKYDEKEHEYPEELEMFRAIQSADQKKKRDKEKDDSSKNRVGKNMMQAIICEEFCWGDASLLISIPNAGLGNAALSAVGTTDQIEKFGNKWLAMAITEPGAGSDSGSIRTTAKPDGEYWILNGEKIFVSCADRCDAVVVWATIDKSAGKAGIKSFLVEKETPGFRLEKLEKKLGLRASDTGSFVLEDCRIPRENLLGNPEVRKKTEGFRGAMKTFDNTRPMVSAMAIGIARAAIEFIKEKLQEKGIKPDYKSTSHLSSLEKEVYLMEAHLEATRLLSWRASWMADNKQFNSLEASMSKAKAGRYATHITQKCCELLGPVGFSCDYLPEKWMRDSKIMDIFEGTGQIQHLIVARNILDLSSNEIK